MFLVHVAAMQIACDHHKLARWLADQLQQGIAITPDIDAYIAATFDSTDLSILLAEGADTEIDSLLELIFYPDLDAQLRYESRWGEHQFTTDQQQEIQTTICNMHLQVPLQPVASDSRVSIQPPDFALEAYVHRLNITWRIEAALARTINRSWPGEFGLRTRVHLRNTRLAWHHDQIRLMDSFLAKVPADTEALEPLLLFLLILLPEMGPGSDDFEFLMAKKFFFFQSLCKAEDFERRRQSSNMETMMLQGNRSAYGSMDEWRRNMRYIDTISQHLFGRTHFFQQPGNACIDLEAGDSGQNIQNVIRILS